MPIEDLLRRARHRGDQPSLDDEDPVLDRDGVASWIAFGSEADRHMRRLRHGRDGGVARAQVNPDVYRLPKAP
jgi:hypothetical protein